MKTVQFTNALSRASALLFAAFALAFLFAAPARAQEEAAPVVLDEPIVQVNNDVIMLSQLRREVADFKEVLVKQRGMTPEQADAEIEKRRPEIIFNLINEALLMQKGKDIPRMSEDVEAEVNREVLRVAQGAGFNKLEDLQAAMQKEGVSLSEVRATLRAQYMKQAVLQREVDSKIYFGLTEKELHDYFDAHRDRFAAVTISEIYLSLAGRSEAEVKAKAQQIVASARGGSDFGDLAAKFSEREDDKGQRIAEKTKGQHLDEQGKPRVYLISEMQPAVADALKSLKAGQVSEPIKTDEGYMILRVNTRDDAFNENFVRGAMTQERSDKEHESYLRGLRKDAYIKPADNYKEVIQPLLDKDKEQLKAAEAGKQETASKQAAEKKEKSKKQ
ncbi:MAG: peptidyl-prolyl cis-trans isomerase [Acidobacteriota bacterium]|nr:peptidyl-prolyl cis-trans isomerase [Acidobacteriota bacterium]